MTFRIDGTAGQRRVVQNLLRQICWKVVVNPGTGAVTLRGGAPPAGSFSTGCACIQDILNSNRVVRVRPLTGPKQIVPGTGGLTIDQAHGGMAIPANDHHLQDATVNPGREPAPPAGDGQVGSDVELWIDTSDNAGRGYPPTPPGVPAPLWVIIAHELTTGHATHFVSGEGESRVDVSGDLVPDFPAEERAAQQSENPHRAAHGLPAR